jgi:competence protein ComEA
LKATGWTLIYGVVCGLLGAGILFLVTRPTQGKPIQILPAPTRAPIQVHVAGAVGNPGVYSLQPGSRVQDAIDASGGLLPGANSEMINLAGLLEDGERVFVPTLAPTAAPGEAVLPERSITIQFPININTATLADLESLPEIGPVTAGNILAYREQNGPFASVEDIEKVSGIGPKTFEKIKDLITVGGE